MKKTTNKCKTTTVSCDEFTREFIAAEAKKANQPQRKVLVRMVKVYKLDQERSAKKKEKEIQELKSANEIFAEINAKLDKAIKRDDVVVSFIKQHETMLSTPTLDKVKSCEVLLNTLVTLLENLQ